MSSDFVVLGHEAKCRINAVPYAVVGGQVQCFSQEHDTSDTEGGDFENARGGLKRMNVDIEAQASVDTNPFAPPLALDEGNVVAFQLYPYGLSGPAFSCTLLVLEFTHAWPLRAPQTFRLRGRSKKVYVKAGE